MADQPKAPKGMEWHLRPGTTEPELRPKQSAEPDDAEEVEADEAETEEPAAKKSATKTASKAARKK